MPGILKIDLPPIHIEEIPQQTLQRTNDSLRNTFLLNQLTNSQPLPLDEQVAFHSYRAITTLQRAVIAVLNNTPDGQAFLKLAREHQIKPFFDELRIVAFQFLFFPDHIPEVRRLGSPSRFLAPKSIEPYLRAIENDKITQNIGLALPGILRVSSGISFAALNLTGKMLTSYLFSANPIMKTFPLVTDPTKNGKENLAAFIQNNLITSIGNVALGALMLYTA
jgi:hypothetical protein